MYTAAQEKLAERERWSANRALSKAPAVAGTAEMSRASLDPAPADDTPGSLADAEAAPLAPSWWRFPSRPAWTVGWHPVVYFLVGWIVLSFLTVPAAYLLRYFYRLRRAWPRLRRHIPGDFSSYVAAVAVAAHVMYRARVKASMVDNAKAAMMVGRRLSSAASSEEGGGIDDDSSSRFIPPEGSGLDDGSSTLIHSNSAVGPIVSVFFVSFGILVLLGPSESQIGLKARLLFSFVVAVVALGSGIRASKTLGFVAAAHPRRADMILSPWVKRLFVSDLTPMEGYQEGDLDPWNLEADPKLLLGLLPAYACAIAAVMSVCVATGVIGCWKTYRTLYFFIGGYGLGVLLLMRSILPPETDLSLPSLMLTFEDAILYYASFFTGAVVLCPAGRTYLHARLVACVVLVRGRPRVPVAQATAAEERTANQQLETVVVTKTVTTTTTTTTTTTRPTTEESTNRAVRLPTDGLLCVACCQRPANHAFIACGHLCACRDCARSIMSINARCPMCRAEATAAIRVFPAGVTSHERSVTALAEEFEDDGVTPTDAAVHAMGLSATQAGASGGVHAMTQAQPSTAQPPAHELQAGVAPRLTGTPVTRAVGSTSEEAVSGSVRLPPAEQADSSHVEPQSARDRGETLDEGV